MKENDKLNKIFGRVQRTAVCSAVALLFVYLWIFGQIDNVRHKFIVWIAPLFFWFIFWGYTEIQIYFYKRGAFTPAKALRFYEKCEKSGVGLPSNDNFEKARYLYFAVFGTDIYSGAGAFQDHMAEVYSAGREIKLKKVGEQDASEL